MFSLPRFLTSQVVSKFLRAGSAEAAAAELGVPLVSGVQDMIDSQSVKYSGSQSLNATQKATVIGNIGALAALTAGRTLSANGTTQTTDFGTIVNLAGYKLTADQSKALWHFMVKGPGLVDLAASGKFSLSEGETAVIYCPASEQFACMSTARVGRILSADPPPNPYPGMEWFDTSTFREFLYFKDADATSGVWVEKGAGSTPPLQVVETQPANGDNIDALAHVDQLHVIIPAAAINALTIALPVAANARVGQVVMLSSYQSITNLYVFCVGGSVVGTSLNSAIPYESYTFVCVKIVGSVATWLRTS